MKRIGLVVLLLFILILTACGQEQLPVIKKAPDFSLTNLDDTTVTLDSTKGKVRLVYFYYSSCNMVCLPTNGIMAKIQSELKKEKVFADKAMLLSISVDLKRDSKEKLLAYADRLKADQSGWYFLRAKDFESVQALASQYSVSVTALEDGEFIHTNAFTLIDGQGQIRKIYTSKDITPNKASEIASDIVGLMNEK